MSGSGPLRFALSHTGGERRRIAGAAFWRAVYELTPLQVPILTGMIVDGLTRGRATLYGVALPPSDPAAILRWAGLALAALAVLHGLSAYASAVTAARVGRGFVSRLRTVVFERLNRLSLDAHLHFGAGELLDRAVNDTAHTRPLVERFFIQSGAKVVRTGYPIAMLVFLDVRLALIALSVLPAQWGVSWLLHRRMHAAVRRTRESRSELTTTVKESLDGVETLKTLRASVDWTGGMRRKAQAVEADELRSGRLSALLRGSVWLTTSLGIALTWWQGGLRVLSGEMTVGTLVVFTGMVLFAYRPIRQLTNLASAYRRGLVSLERVQELLALPEAEAAAGEEQPLRLTEGRVEFREVSFSHGARRVLDRVSLIAPARQLTAIVGRSGAGKSAVLRLLAQLYEPEEGTILIDGQALARTTSASLREQLAVVPQHPVLFSGTVRENLTLANPRATQRELVNACASSAALDFIGRLAHGFETRLGRRGQSLSGGEAHRLAIARALLTHPKILLLDEPTSALDPESALALVETLLRLRSGGMTVIVVGHQLGTVRLADRIVVIDGGRVVASGCHESLILQSRVYS
ncbi:MAG: ABC transporter ATP-binding protein, partial [Gemmatimonadales bacterium]|nr:ABC transporter ATP-binding protein [Gemmatimonadales bacterium]